MNFFVVLLNLGKLVVTFGAAMAPSLAWALYDQDASRAAIGGAMGVTIGAGLALMAIGGRRKQELYRREAMAIVGLGWIVCAAAGALPFYFADIKELSSFTDCYFESMSGLTTTGATVISDIESLPRGLLFWRSFTHWLGGLGIIMLFVAILPYLGAGGRQLVKSEVTGPVKEGLTPRIKDTALLLYRIYIGYTVAETSMLWGLTEMGLFDSLCHTFGTLATGGFSTRNTSIAAYDSVAIETIIILFMFLAGSNFALMHGLFRGKQVKIWRDSEWRVYAIGVAAISAFIAVRLWISPLYDSIGQAARDSVFTVLSLQTTTGFVTADFEQWPIGVKCLLFAIMFVGGCAGSTGGGMKVIRWIIVLKMARGAVEKVYSPHRVRKLKLAGAVVSDDIQRSTVGFFILWMLVMISGSFLIAVIEGENFDHLMTPFAAVAATLNNIGPGFYEIGAVENYAFFSSPSKWLLSLFMALGRLELYSIMVLFIPRFWTAD